MNKALFKKKKEGIQNMKDLGNTEQNKILIYVVPQTTALRTLEESNRGKNIRAGGLVFPLDSLQYSYSLKYVLF